MKISLIIILMSIAQFSALKAKEVIIGLEDFKPYYIAEEKSGLVPDLIAAAFLLMPEHTPRFLYGHSNKRLLANFKNGQLDVIPNVDDSTQFDGCRSNSIISYNNIAVTNARSEITLTKISDLLGKSIVSFQGAKTTLGKEFRSSLTEDQYFEVVDLRQQVKMLYRKRVDVSVGDKLLFLFNLNTLNLTKTEKQQFEFFPIFAPVKVHLGFRDTEVCEQFNKALVYIRKNGVYNKIYQSYVERLTE